MTNPRVSRGRTSQVLVAEALRSLFPRARTNPASLSGKDVLETPRLAVEVKARRNFNPVDFIRQAVKNAEGGDLPAVVLRLNGQGPKAINDWPVMLRLGDFIDLLRAAGYGGEDEDG